MPIYAVLDNLDRGKRYAPGTDLDRVEMSEDEAAPLIAIAVLGKAIADADADAKPKGKKDNDDGKSAQ